MQLRYPDVPLAGKHYESVYVALVHPDQPRAVWVRTTVQKRPGQQATGALWVTWFDQTGVRAGKLNNQPLTASTELLRCGPAAQGPTGSTGLLEQQGLSATWDLAFATRAPAFEHLAPLLYRAPLPRTKATSPVPDLAVSGSMVIDGGPIDLTGWTGMVGHNWGTEHAARWIWLRVPGLGEDGGGWLDAVLGRVRVGPVLAPWTAFGALSLDGQLHRLGGLLRRGTAVEIGPDGTAGARITLAGPTAKVYVDATISLASSVAWKYSDPGGHGHEVVNSSVASMKLEVKTSAGTRRFTPKRPGVLEIGGDERAFDLPIQPFED